MHARVCLCLSGCGGAHGCLCEKRVVRDLMHVYR